MTRPNFLAPNADTVLCHECGKPAFLFVRIERDGTRVEYTRCTDPRCRHGGRVPVNGGAA